MKTKNSSFIHASAILLSLLMIISCTWTAFGSETPADAWQQGIPYLEFYAERNGKDPADIDLSRAVCLIHSNWECEMGYPNQYIKDEEIIRTAADLISRITVTGGPDGIFSTAEGHGFTFLDEEENQILSISIQEGMIETSEGRYEADGISSLSEIPGVMYPGDWNEYFNQFAEEEEEYLDTHKLSYPCSLFEADGKAAFDFYNNCTADDILSIYFFHAGKNRTVTDPEEIRAIYDALCRVQVTGPGKASRWDDSFSVTIFYEKEDLLYTPDIEFSFRSGALDGRDEHDYAVEGLSGILESYDWEEFEMIAGLIG
ncbi:MAG: hypothetical protein IJ106_11605 [Parasporobacterium sp.]|nr:hypothetical protein [Parasporobacterium sp.]